MRLKVDKLAPTCNCQILKLFELLTGGDESNGVVGTARAYTRG